MLIDSKELLDEFIRPTLRKFSIDISGADYLLLGTAAQESHLQFYIHHNKCQQNKGLGLYQITHEMHWDVWDNYLAYNADMASAVRGLASQHTFLTNPDAKLTTNLDYATAIAWLIYKKNSVKLPKQPTNKELAKCWFNYYVHHKTANQNDFVNNYETYINQSYLKVA
jgi:hypothetical protein